MSIPEERSSVVLKNRGQKIFATFHRPLISGKIPCVIMFHGLAGHKTGKHRLYVTLSKNLSSMGIGSLRIDFRGSGDSEGEFYNMTLEGNVEDAWKGIEWIENNPFVDNDRIGVFGRSFGGAVAIIIAEQLKKTKSLVVWAPVFNGDQWQLQWDVIKRISGNELSEELMTFDGQLAHINFWHQFFNMRIEQGLQQLDQIPFLHIHGEKDPVVDISHAEQYAQIRENAIAPTKFIRLPHSDHDFSHPEEQKIAIKETSQWFKMTL